MDQAEETSIQEEPKQVYKPALFLTDDDKYDETLYTRTLGSGKSTTVQESPGSVPGSAKNFSFILELFHGIKDLVFSRFPIFGA